MSYKHVRLVLTEREMSRRFKGIERERRERGGKGGDGMVRVIIKLFL
jgi:hypothetical protein